MGEIVESTNSRNYRVLQTPVSLSRFVQIYEQQKLQSPSDRDDQYTEYHPSTNSRNYRVLQTCRCRVLRVASTNSRNYRVLQTDVGSGDRLVIYEQQKLQSPSDCTLVAHLLLQSTNSRNYRVLQTLTGAKVVCFQLNIKYFYFLLL